MKPIFIVAFVVALAADSFYCGAAVTPEQAMKCCDSMPCSSQGQQGQDCCNAMPSAHASFVQPTSLTQGSFALVLFAVLQNSIDSHGDNSSDRVITAFAYDPPI